jgi:hypothetical protein
MVRQAHHDHQEPDHPELAEGDILSLPKDDRLTMIAFALGQSVKCHRLSSHWNLCVLCAFVVK